MTLNASETSVARMTWDRVEARLASGAIAILPVGAGAKQHGLHLPMSTDAVIAEHLAGLLAARVDALVWPVVSYGSYPAFTAYAGSVSLTAETFEAVVRELIDGLIACAARAVIVLDTGVSTNAPIARAVSASTRARAILHHRVFSLPRYVAAARALTAQSHGSHADELETSLVLAVAPHLVDMSRAAPSPPVPDGPQPGPLQRHDPAGPNYSASGS